MKEVEVHMMGGPLDGGWGTIKSNVIEEALALDPSNDDNLLWMQLGEFPEKEFGYLLVHEDDEYFWKFQRSRDKGVCDE